MESHSITTLLHAVELDLTATEMLGFHSKSRKYKHDSDLMSDPENEKTTPISSITGMISISVE